MSYSPTSFNVQTSQAQSVITYYVNNTGLAIPQGSPVSVDPSDGSIVLTDATSLASVEQFVGLASARIPTATLGPVISQGRLLNIVTDFSVGNAIWVGLGGTLTNSAPTAGVGGFTTGDVVVFLGVLVENETNDSLTDLQLFPQTTGQL